MPYRQPAATAPVVVVEVEDPRRERKRSAARIVFELGRQGITIVWRTVSRHLVAPRLNRRRFIDPNGQNIRAPQTIIARPVRHMIPVDVKKVGWAPNGGGWRSYGRGSPHARAVDRARAAGARRGNVHLHSAVDGFSQLASTEALCEEKAVARHGDPPG